MNIKNSLFSYFKLLINKRFAKKKMNNKIKILKWQEIKLQGDVFSPRFGHSLAEFQENFYIFGGIDSLNKRNDLYRINCT